MLDSSAYIEGLWKNEKLLLNGESEEQKLHTFLEKLTTQFKEIYNEKQEIVNKLEVKLQSAEDIFKSGLESKAQKLNSINIQVKTAIANFKQASETAVRIGDRLAVTELERKTLVRAIDIIKTIDVLEKIEPVNFQEMLQNSLSFMTVKNSLSETLRKKDLKCFCLLLLDIRKVLIDIKSDDVSKAQTNSISLSQLVESELLDEFDSDIVKFSLIATKSTDKDKVLELQILRHTQDLVECLYTFSEGQSLEKRYLFRVVQLMFTDGRQQQQQQQSSNGMVDIDDEDEDEDEDQEERSVDRLSKLFGHILRICKEQFEIIAMIFPMRWGRRVMRALILRIFNDPAFGIQTQINRSLYPEPPQQQLNLDEYLNMLGNVREKLSAFHILLSDYACMFGFISEEHVHDRSTSYEVTTKSEIFRKSNKNMKARGKTNSKYGLSSSSSSLAATAVATATGVGINANEDNDDDDDDDDIMSTSAEIKLFLKDQVAQVFNSYISEYFSKEFTHLKFQYHNVLTRSLNDYHVTAKFVKSAVTSATVLSSLPILKPEKLKTIINIERTIANHEFIELVFQQTSDALARLSNIARDDKKLSLTIKDLYILHIKFLYENVLTPISAVSTTLLLRQSLVSPHMSSLPPVEFLQILGCIMMSIEKNKLYFTNHFSSYFVNAPNLLVVCQEARKNSLRMLMTNSKEALVAWGVAVAAHLDKMLFSLQSKHDFKPNHEDDLSLPLSSDGKVVKRGFECTSACTHVCKAIALVVQCVRFNACEFIGIDMKTSLWTYFGRLFVGILISHIRRFKISVSGARRLQKDLDEYYQLLTLLEVPETLDLMHCLKEVVSVLLAPAHLVVKLVIETLRHLDVKIVTALLCSRADYTTSTGAVWVNDLTKLFGSCNSSAVFPWENRKSMSILAFKAAVASDLYEGGNLSTRVSHVLAFGPVTLRKSWAPLSAAYTSELLQTSYPSTAAYVYTQEIIAATPELGPRTLRDHNLNYSTHQHIHHTVDQSAGTGSKQQTSISSLAHQGLKGLSSLVPQSTAQFITQLVQENQQRRDRFINEDYHNNNGYSNNSNGNDNDKVRRREMVNEGLDDDNESSSDTEGEEVTTSTNTLRQQSSSEVNSKGGGKKKKNKHKTVVSLIDAQKDKLIKGFTSLFS